MRIIIILLLFVIFNQIENYDNYTRFLYRQHKYPYRYSRPIRKIYYPWILNYYYSSPYIVK